MSYIAYCDVVAYCGNARLKSLEKVHDAAFQFSSKLDSLSDRFVAASADLQSNREVLLELKSVNSVS